MKNNQVVKLALVTTLIVASFSGCSLDDKSEESTNKSGDNIVIEKVETSLDLLSENDTDVDSDSEVSSGELEEFDLSNIENFNNFKLSSINSEYIEYSQANKENFEKILKPIFESNKVFTEEKILTYDEFIDTYIWDDASGNGIYLSDINNDKVDDIVVVYKHAGSGNYSGITTVFLKKGNAYESVMIESDGEFLSNDIRLLSFDNITYVGMTYGILDEIYIWKENTLLKIADEADFVDNAHTLKDTSLINDAIFKEFELNNKELELIANDISYTNSGYSNEEILLTYFKIKKFIETDDKEAMANLIMYPIKYEENDKFIKVYNKEQFIENYDKIITDEIRKVVSESDYKEIFSNWQGAMLGSGKIWFTSYIIGIN